MTLINGSNVTIGHLGIVVGVFDTLEIGQYIDEVIPMGWTFPVRDNRIILTRSDGSTVDGILDFTKNYPKLRCRDPKGPIGCRLS